ncbi:hypothetical protein SAMN05216483_2744 [Streptomyces sp. 2131.1]|uniref:hypothetical protein n=1 Tax=Streptomyces sp. 2131.1 TaxID=1855346 RepID=UPI00089971CB|nr:hypothetical protein [Streptomyces sp. 2131.1]SEC94802.1 hypothetical protein SAMN05216483_2744 [Streptomyces sp. 2131.1]
MFAGEDRNDCDILAALIRAHRPDIADAAKLVRINDPVRLRRKSGPKLAAAVEVLVGKARAKARQQRAELHGFVVHEDLDGYTNADYKQVRGTLAAELARQCPGFRTAFALAAWETEGWLLLFPEAFPHVHPRWKVPAHLLDKDTGRVKNAKEELRRGLGLPLFRESDGPSVAREAQRHGLIPSPRGTNRSYEDFVGDLADWS